MNVEIGAEAALFPGKEYISGIFVAVRIVFYKQLSTCPGRKWRHTPGSDSGPSAGGAAAPRRDGDRQGRPRLHRAGRRSFRQWRYSSQLKNVQQRVSERSLGYVVCVLPIFKVWQGTLQMKDRWESNINVWFPFMYSLKWNCYVQNRIIMFCLQFLYSYITERFIYFQDRSAYSAVGKYVDWPWKYINRSKTRECGNWEWGRAIPRNGIHEKDFRCCTAPAATNYPSLRNPLNGCQGHPPPCLSPPDRRCSDAQYLFNY